MSSDPLYPADSHQRGDAIWEHKNGKVWRIVEKLERENCALRYHIRVLQARVRRAS